MTDRFTEQYLEQLADLLATEFTASTGIIGKGRCGFVFISLLELSDGKLPFIVEGDLVGPDNCANDSPEITWNELKGAPVSAKWTKLNIPTLQREYAKPKASKINFGKMPFKVTWQPWWDTNLPDFGIQISFAGAPSASVIKRLKVVAASLEPAWQSIKQELTIVHVDFDFGAAAPIRENIVKLFDALKKVHTTDKITNVTVGQ
ncbi:MAG: hypothetical protein ACXWKG_04830 [Limisphaerales bacterium]